MLNGNGLPPKRKFFEIETGPYLLDDQQQTVKFRDLIGGGWTSYGQKAGEKDGLKISYSDGSSPDLPLWSRW